MHSIFLEELKKLEKQGLLRSLRRVESAQGPRIMLEGKEVINLCANNYLGLANHAALKNAAIKALEIYGTGTSASRLISGTTRLHIELEKKIAGFKGTEAGLVFNSGYAANVGIISAIVGRGDIVYSDKLNHASIIDGCLLSGAEFKRYPHCDTAALETMLKGQGARVKGQGKRLIVTDTVFSMDGDIAPLPELVELANKYNCMLMVDEAHATGVLGKNGKGAVEYFGLADEFHSEDFIQMGTLSKALGGFGAYVAGPKALIDYLVNKSRAFIYTTALPAPAIAAAIAALDIVQNQPQLRQQLWENVKFFRKGLEKIGINTMNSQTQAPLNTSAPARRSFSGGQIIPILIGDNKKAVQVSSRLLQEGVFIQAIRPPTVPAHQARLRLTVMATHTKPDLKIALEKINKTIKC